MLFIGDSRVLSWETDGLPDTYCITKIADGGLTSHQVLSRLKEIQIPSCDWVIVQIGINDLHLIKKNGVKDIENCKKNISDIVDFLVFNKKKIILTTLLPISKIPIKWAYFWDKRQTIDAIKQINLHILGEQTQKGVFVLDTYKLLASEDGFLSGEFVDNDFFLHVNQNAYAKINATFKDYFY